MCAGMSTGRVVTRDAGDDVVAALDAARERWLAAEVERAAARAQAVNAVARARAAGWTLERLAGRMQVTRTTVERWLQRDARR